MGALEAYLRSGVGEYLGVVYRVGWGDTARYGYTLTQGGLTSTTIYFHAGLPKGAEPVALVHSHGPLGPDTFSGFGEGGDLRLARDRKMPIYLGTPGEVLVADPAHTDKVMTYDTPFLQRVINRCDREHVQVAK